MSFSTLIILPGEGQTSENRKEKQHNVWVEEESSLRHKVYSSLSVSFCPALVNVFLNLYDSFLETENVFTCII